MSASVSQGVVYLVGAGPGDPGLLTVRGRLLLEQADTVVYDHLANAQLLRHCRDNAERIYVGKQAARHALTQDQINTLLIERGQSGRRVVRLKGGDPFVFGRGGEECEALARVGVRFEVVPGVTAAIAAPAYAGIPVTHRDLNSSFTLVTGHEKEEEYRDPEARTRAPAAGSSDVDWSALARLPCLAFYMGVKSLPRICARLLEHGMDPSTPAATIAWGTTPRQRTVVATLTNLSQQVAQAGIAPPAMTIVGRGVSLRETLAWFESRPLFGQTVVVTRTREQVSELAERLAELGAEVLEAPTIALAPPSDWGEVDAALRRAGEYDWVVFTSANGVRRTVERLRALGLDARALGAAKVAAVGDATADAVRDILCLRVDLCPPRFVAEALADELERRGEIAGGKFLLLRADIARPVLVNRLRAGGAAIIDDIAVYRTRSVPSLPEEVLAALDKRRVTWVTFTSGSTVKNFADLLGQAYRDRLHGVRLASIGPITTSALAALGLQPAIQADPSDISGLIRAILAARTT